MKRYEGKLRKAVTETAVLLFALLLVFPARAMAEETEAELVYLETPGEFTVMFTYDGERPEIVFISPSGKEYGEGISSEDEFLYAHGSLGGWSTYKVLHGEAGQWRLRCDKKNNEEITYQLVEVVNGICIQSFSIVDMENGFATVAFEVTKGEEEAEYTYTISAVATEAGERVKKELKTGRAHTGTLQEESVPLTISSGEDYRLLLEVVHGGSVETFDSMETEQFSYENPDTGEAIGNFSVDLDMGSGLCQVDWKDFAVRGGKVQYKLVAVADGNTEEPVYSVATEDTAASFYVPAKAEKLAITISYVKDGVASEAKTKEIALEGGEYLKVRTEDITDDATLTLEYQVTEPAELYLTLNEESGMYEIKGKDTLLFPLENGQNTIEAYFEGSGGIIYRVSREIYYSFVSPVITLYEELDEKVFVTETARVAGKIENAAALTVNGVPVDVDEKGNFVYDVPLTAGRNEVTIVASTKTGVSTVRTLTITNVAAGSQGAATGTDSIQTSAAVLPEMKAAGYFPLIVSAVLAMVLVAVFFLATAKKKKVPAVFLIVLLGCTALAAGFLYFRLHAFNNSLEYVSLAKDSAVLASKYLTYETYAGYAAKGTAALFLGTAAALTAGMLLKKRKNAKTKEQ